MYVKYNEALTFENAWQETIPLPPRALLANKRAYPRSKSNLKIKMRGRRQFYHHRAPASKQESVSQAP